MSKEWVSILEGLGIFLGLVLAFWGIFHQLIVGGLTSLFRNAGSTELRVVMMSWVTQGAFLSFCGILPAALLFFHGMGSGAVQTALLLCGAALIFLAVHIFMSKVRGHLRPLSIGAFLQLFYGIYLIIFVILSYPSFQAR